MGFVKKKKDKEKKERLHWLEGRKYWGMEANNPKEESSEELLPVCDYTIVPIQTS